MIARSIMLLSVTLLTSCATFDQSLSYPASSWFNPNSSRALYLYSRSRLAMHDNDGASALSLLSEALEHDPSSAYLHTAVAMIKQKTGDTASALNYLQRAIKLDPAAREPYGAAGSILSSLGRDKEAIPYLKKAIEFDPDKEDAYLHLSVSQSRLLEYADQVDTLKTLVNRNGESFLGFYYLGRAYSQTKLYREALGYYTKALEIRPDLIQASIDMAATYEAMGSYDEAIKLYQGLSGPDLNRAAVAQHLVQLLIQQRRFKEAIDYLSSTPESGFSGRETKRKIGLLHMELEEYEQAAGIFAEMVQQDPEDEQILLYLGVCYEEMGDLDRSMTLFRNIPTSSSFYADAVGHQAFILKEQGKAEEAVSFLQGVIGARPERLEPYLSLSALLESLGRTEQAVEILTDAEKYFVHEPRYHFRIGVLFDKQGKRNDSIERMKRVLAINPLEANALNYLGYTYAEMGINLEEGLGYLKQAVTLRPNDGFFLDSLGWIYYKMKNYDQALIHLEEANRLEEEDSTISEHLGDLYHARRDTRKALKWYKKALELDPERKELQEKVRKLKGEGR